MASSEKSAQVSSVATRSGVMVIQSIEPAATTHTTPMLVIAIFFIAVR
jgi:hypothetical protein